MRLLAKKKKNFNLIKMHGTTITINKMSCLLAVSSSVFHFHKTI